MVSSHMIRTAVVAIAALAGAARSAHAGTVLLDFTSPHCGPCAEMQPVLQQLVGLGHDVRHVDVTQDRATPQQFGINVTPTYVVVIDGREWARVTGKTKLATMIEMLHKSQAMAAAASRAAAPTAADPSGTAPISAVASDGQTMPISPGTPGVPQEGRVVPIQDPFSIRPPARTADASPQAAVAQQQPAPQPPAAGDAAHLIAATVKLSITDPGGKSSGTGAIVDARNGMALVLTCGHLFRESQGAGPIEISLFTPGPNGAVLRETVPGELLDYDLERDLALVRFRTQSPVSVAAVAPANTILSPNAPVTAVGCSHGDNPTAWSTRITAINRYQGFPNVEAATAPVEGRSGGGLFNAQGQVIGICFAADPQGDEGLYASLASIHAKLDELQLSSVYQSPSTSALAAPAAATIAAPIQLAAAQAAPAPQSFAVRGQDPAPAASGSSTLASQWPASASVSISTPTAAATNPAAAPAPAATTPAHLDALTAEERAALEEIARRSAGGEVICIIRPQGADGRSDVIKLSGVSPAFVRALAASADTAIPTAGSAAPAQTAAAPGSLLR